jgi:hypothetical protein
VLKDFLWSLRPCYLVQTLRFEDNDLRAEEVPVGLLLTDRLELLRLSRLLIPVFPLDVLLVIP